MLPVPCSDFWYVLTLAQWGQGTVTGSTGICYVYHIVDNVCGGWVVQSGIMWNEPEGGGFMLRADDISGGSPDIALPATVDAEQEDLGGPEIRRILRREFQVYGKPECEGLVGLSVSHLYNLRHSVSYQRRRVQVAPPGYLPYFGKSGGFSRKPNLRVPSNRLIRFPCRGRNKYLFLHHVPVR